MTNQELVTNKQEDIPTLRAKLLEINAQKEEWFTKKEELNKEIAGLIESLKKLNPEINEAKKRERELLQKRNENNKKFREFLAKSKELVKGRNVLEEKYGHGATPSNIKERIEKLEYSIETNVLTMSKEKKIMDEIKLMRKTLEEAGPIANYKNEMKEISQVITQAKEEADKCHNELKMLQKENKKNFKEYLFNSRKVNQLKKSQREAFNNFVKYKTEFVQLNSSLKQSMPEKKRRERPREQRFHEPNRLQHEFIENARIIDENVRRVEKKIKEKKKLTTQDIIAMQGKEQDKA